MKKTGSDGSACLFKNAQGSREQVVETSSYEDEGEGWL